MAKNHRQINNFKDQVQCNTVIYLILINLCNKIINVRLLMISTQRILAPFQKSPYLSRTKLTLKKVECLVKPKSKSLKKLKNNKLKNIRILYTISRKRKVELVVLITNQAWDQMPPRRKLFIKKLKEPITILNFKQRIISTQKQMQRILTLTLKNKFTNKTLAVVALYLKNEII